MFTFNRFFYCLLALIVFYSCQTAYAKEFTLDGKIERVTDGDSIRLVTKNSAIIKIRLLGIDAPESNQAFGAESTKNLMRLGHSKEVVAQCIGIDRYRRSLCKILSDGVDLNLEQVKYGMAWHYKEYSKSQSNKDQVAYASAERSAQSSRLGLWSSDEAVPPWNFRKGIVEKVKSSSYTDGTVKMSRSKICHEPGGSYYSRVKNFRSFNTLEECINAGGKVSDSGGQTSR
jgi:endonuclease YncB( thermonuclease family)